MISLPILLASLGCAMAIVSKPLYKWKSFKYLHANPTGVYNSTNVMLFDAGMNKAGKIIVTTPRTDDANPASLCTVSNETDADGQALLEPYPSPEFHVVGDCSKMTNVLRTIFDEDDNLWIVDSGVIANEVICPPQIVKVDTKTDQILLRYKIPEKVSQGGLLAIVGVRTDGSRREKTQVISVDLWGGGLVIFDGCTSWRLNNDCFKPNSNFTTFKTNGHTVNMNYGTIGFLFLGKKFADFEMGLMWSPSVSHGYGLSVQDLFNSRDSQKKPLWYEAEYEFPRPALAGAISKGGILFGSFVQQKVQCVWIGNKIIKENVYEPIPDIESSLSIISMKTITHVNGNEYLMLVATNQLERIAGIPNPRNVTTAIYLFDIAKLTNDTPCQPKGHFVHGETWAEKGFIPLDNPNGCDL